MIVLYFSFCYHQVNNIVQIEFILSSMIEPE